MLQTHLVLKGLWYLPSKTETFRGPLGQAGVPTELPLPLFLPPSPDSKAVVVATVSLKYHGRQPDGRTVAHFSEATQQDGS
jgi:hypothetical protein